MERANRIGARAAVILGADEIAEGAAVVRNLDQGTQQRVPLDEVVRALAETGLVGARSRDAGRAARGRLRGRRGRRAARVSIPTSSTAC